MLGAEDGSLEGRRREEGEESGLCALQRACVGAALQLPRASRASPPAPLFERTVRVKFGLDSIFQQHLDSLGLPLVGGCVQRRIAAAFADGGICAGRQQQLDDARVACEAGHDQWRLLVAAQVIHVGACLDGRLDLGLVTYVHRVAESRRGALPSGCIQRRRWRRRRRRASEQQRNCAAQEQDVAAALGHENR